MKAILVIDEMPKNCGECRFCDGDCCYITSNKNEELGGVILDCVDHLDIREDWCPLKPMPETKETYTKDKAKDYWIACGWNACIEELEKNERK